MIALWLGVLGLCWPAPQKAYGESGQDTIAAFQQRRGQCPAEDLEGRLALAHWADENALWEQADQIYRQILSVEPGHEKAHASLVVHAEAHPLPTDSAACAAARDLLPGQFIEHESRRFVVLSDASTNSTRNQAERLERTYHQFHRFTRRIGLKPLPLKHRLVCILFQSRDDYQVFARAHDGVSDPWIAGYYSPRNDRIVFYDIESNPSLTKARSKLHQMRTRMELLGSRLDRAEDLGREGQAESLRHTLARYQRHMANEQMRVDQFARTADIATTIHEATHQLMFHAGVQSPYVQYPIWICEGLATSFETDSPQEAFGPDQEYAPRREGFEAVLSADGLVDLKQLVTIAVLSGRSDEQVKTVYHQSYALVTWMSRFRKTELRNYLLSMLKEPPGQPESQRHLELFEQAFGDVDKLERSWLRHEVSLLSSASAAAITRRRLAAYEQPLHWGGAQYRAQEPVGLAKVFADAAYNYNPLSISLVAAVGSEAAEIEELDSGALLITGVLWE